MRAKRSVAFSQRVLWKQLQMEMFTFFKQRERERRTQKQQKRYYIIQQCLLTLEFAWRRGSSSPPSSSAMAMEEDAAAPAPATPIPPCHFALLSSVPSPARGDPAISGPLKKKRNFFFFVTFSGELDDGFVLLGLVWIWGFLGFRGFLSVWAIFVDLTLLCFSQCGK